jgi:hypothetical protein
VSKNTVEQVVLEIIKLPSGDYAMRKAGEEEPLITVTLSQKVKDGLNGQSGELARMILVEGAKMMSELSLASVEASEPPKPVIH